MKDGDGAVFAFGMMIGALLVSALIGVILGWKPVPTLRASADDWFKCKSPRFLVDGKDSNGTELTIYQCEDGTVLGRRKEKK